MTPPQTENIPAELREIAQWVTWKYNGKKTKLPCSVATGQVAGAHEPKSWGSFDQALSAYRKRNHAGIGFDFTADDPYGGIDLDDCIRDDGTITPKAAKIIAYMQTYSEISPSKKGVKLIFKGHVPECLTKTPLGDGSFIEIYSARRYFTVTGDHLPGTPRDIRVVGDELTTLCDSLRPAPKRQPEQPRSIPVADASDDHIRRYVLGALQKARACVMAAEDGVRHDTRRDEAYGLAGYLWTGAITRQDIFDALAVNFGKDQRTAEKTIWDAIAKGEEKPRDVPLPEHRASHTKQSLPPTTDDDLENLEGDELRRRLRAAVAERDAISAERDYWKERCIQRELELDQVKERNRFVTQTHGAEGIGNPGTRLTFIELKKEIDRVPLEEREAGQWVHIRPSYMAACSSQNRSTISKHLKLLRESGYIETKVRKVQDPETGEWSAGTFVRPLVDLSDPTQVVIPSKPRGRSTCRKCGKDNLRRKIYCADCNTVQSDEPVNPPDSDVQTENQEADAVKEAISFFEGQPSQEAEAPATGLMCHTPHNEKLATVFSSELQPAHQKAPTDSHASEQKEVMIIGSARLGDAIVNLGYIKNRLKVGDLSAIETHCQLAGADYGTVLAAVQEESSRQALAPIPGTPLHPAPH